MKIAIISDIHGNFAALCSLREEWDELWVIGDLVNVKGGVKVDQCGGAKGSHLGPEIHSGMGARASGA
jgi:hypothetical protein